MKLGRIQKEWLDWMASSGRKGEWWPGSGSLWSTQSATIKICESLVNRGYLERVKDSEHEDHFRITEAGYTAINWPFERPRDPVEAADVPRVRGR